MQSSCQGLREGNNMKMGWGIGLVAVLVASVAVASRLASPALSRTLMQRAQAACPECEIQWEGLRIRASGLEFTQIHFRTDPAKDTVITADLDRIQLFFSWWKMAAKKIDIDLIRLEKPRVKVKEGTRRDPKSEGGDAPVFAVHRAELSDGEFTYEKQESSKVGLIRIENIQVALTPIGNRPDLHDIETKAEVTAKLENSGKIQLEVQALVFAPAPEVKVHLTLTSFPLKKVNTYFHPIDGVLLDGTLSRGESEVEISGPVMKAWTELQYRDFDLKFEKNRSRSGVSAFFSSIVADVKLSEDRKAARKKSVTGRRKPNESLVSFILRGMKEAALKVATI